MTADFDHRLTPEGREGFLACVSYIALAATMAMDSRERSFLVALATVLRAKADQEYLIGKPSEAS